MNPVTDQQTRVCAVITKTIAEIADMKQPPAVRTRLAASVYQGVIDALSMVIGGSAAHCEWTPRELDGFLDLFCTRLKEQAREFWHDVR